MTLLYGLNNTIPMDKIKSAVKYSGESPKIKGMRIFEGEESDALVCEVEKEDWIIEINKELKELDYKNDYPEYIPHITLAYLKK